MSSMTPYFKRSTRIAFATAIIALDVACWCLMGALLAIVMTLFFLILVILVFSLGYPRWEIYPAYVGQHLQDCAKRVDGLHVVAVGQFPTLPPIYVMDPGENQVVLEGVRNIRQAIAEADRLLPLEVSQ